MIYRPLYVDKIMAYVDTPFVKILTGVRRCGKSTILKMIMERLKTQHNIPEERIVSCRYDSMEYEDMTAKQMYAQLKERLSPDGKTYLFLDEVQEIKGWEKVVNSLASDFDVDLYVTGSNSRMMSSEISTYLTGRYVSFRIFTLSFGEYLMFKSQYTEVGEPKAELANFVRLGGFPATHLQEFSQDEVYTIVRDIYNSTIFSDIVKRRRAHLGIDDALVLLHLTGVRACARDDGDAAVDVIDHAFQCFDILLQRGGRRLARGAERKDRVRTVGDVPVTQLPKAGKINAAVLMERSDQRDDGTG